MNPRRVLRIARWEATNTVGTVDRRSAVAIVIVVAALAVSVPAAATANPAPGAGIYQVGVDEESPYHAPVTQDRRLQVVPTDDGVDTDEMDVLVRDEGVLVADTDTGRAAAGALEEAIVSYNDRQMALESDQAAAFPVTVTVRYLPQEEARSLAASLSATDASDETERESSSDAETVVPTSSEGVDGTGDAENTDTDDYSNADTARPTEMGEQQTGTGDGTAEPSRSTTDDAPVEADGQRTAGPLDGIFGGTQSGTPGSISPPFPLTALLLAFVFLLPFNVVIQAYGGSVFEERLNRRGEPLLVSPATRGDIVLGKTLPYLLLTVLVTALIALGVGGGLWSVAAIAPLAALFLAATFVAGMLVRSYKELTFVTVTISVALTAYAFVPAVFTTVHPIAAISPLSVVVDDLQGAPISLGAFVLSTGPVALAATVLFVLGTGLYREEYLFARRPLPSKVVDAIAAPLDGWRDVALWTALFIPFVFVAELFAVAVLFVLPTDLSIPVLLAVIALVEEVAKSAHVLAGFERSRFDRSLSTGLALGAASGLGFFLAEKAMAVTQLVGLPGLDVGRAAFGPVLGGPTAGLLLLGPLALHVVTASISAVGASRSRRHYLVGLGVAVLVHVGYNLAVVTQIA